MLKTDGPNQKSSPGENQAQRETVRQIWRTRDVSEKEGFSYFCDAVCEAFMELTPSRTSSKAFSAVVESVKLPNGRLNKVCGSNHSIDRTGNQINRANAPSFFLNIQLRSQCVISQANNQVTLNQGQLALFDGTRPFGIHHPMKGDMAVASLQLPRVAVENAAYAYGIDISRLCGNRVSDHPNLGPLAVSTMRTLVDRGTIMKATDAQVLIDGLVGLCVASCAPSEEATPYENAKLRPLLLVAVMDFIEQNLESHELSINVVSVQFGVTPRYVHKMFKNIERSFSHYVRDRRLDKSMVHLRNPENARTTIADIAFSNGFSDLSSFNRRFKERFGSTPREIRRG